MRKNLFFMCRTGDKLVRHPADQPIKHKVTERREQVTVLQSFYIFFECLSLSLSSEKLQLQNLQLALYTRLYNEHGHAQIKRTTTNIKTRVCLVSSASVNTHFIRVFHARADVAIRPSLSSSNGKWKKYCRQRHVFVAAFIARNGRVQCTCTHRQTFGQTFSNADHMNACMLQCGGAFESIDKSNSSFVSQEWPVDVNLCK